MAPPALAPLRNSVAAAAPLAGAVHRAAMGIIDDYYGGYENLHSHGYDYDAAFESANFGGGGFHGMRRAIPGRARADPLGMWSLHDGGGFDGDDSDSDGD